MGKAARRTGAAPAALALVLALAAGCAVLGVDAQDQAFQQSTVLVGTVGTRDGRRDAVVVGAYAAGGSGWHLVHQTRLHEPGGYELIVPQGAFTLFAFADRNGNGLFDAGEPAARHDDGRAVAASGSGMRAGLDMTLGDGTLAVPRIAAAAAHSTQAGARADLDAAPFTAAQGLEGYWRPVDFFRQWGGNVYFVEPYDARKTPVLFVHGAAGSPQDWRALIDSLDRARYQPWLFLYPSGAAVESMSHLLYWKLLNLQLRYRFARLDIVAHSMGGLVVRRFLLDHGVQFPQIRHFVSLSTPWAGEPSADLGVRHSPGVVPSWRDMQPEGPFMRSLFDRRLPAGVEHDLLFGHRGGHSLLRPNNDGTVTLASQLRRAAQAEARRIYGFDEDHASILRSPAVAAQLKLLLDEDERPLAQGRARLRLQLGDVVPQGLQTLVLRAVDDAAAPMLTVMLPAAQADAELGPLPTGRYRAGLLAPGFAAQPMQLTVDLSPGTTPTLEFVLLPQGTLAGYVGEGAARPAGAYRAPDAALRIRAITLSGVGVSRRLVPIADRPDAAVERLLAGEDAAWGASFAFVGLPEGTYELTIEADGHAPHRSSHRVVAGRSGQLEPIVLQPLR